MCTYLALFAVYQLLLLTNYLLWLVHNQKEYLLTLSKDIRNNIPTETYNVSVGKYCQKFMGKTQNIFNIYSKCIKIIIIESNKTSTGSKKISQRQYRNNTLGNNSTNERKNSHGHYDHINSAKENRKQLHYQIHRASRS